MMGIWQTGMLVHLILAVITTVLLIKAKTEVINKVLEALLIWFIPILGSVCVIVLLRSGSLKKAA